MIKIYISLLSLVLFFIACSSDAKDNNITQVSQDNKTIPAVADNTNKIATQPIIYHDSAGFPILKSGYGTFGSYEVATKSIKNSGYDEDLQTTLFYPKELTTSRPTIFFYAGANIYNSDTYKGLFYFVASQGYNIIFITYANYSLRPLPAATQEALTAFTSHIDKTKVGFSGHSMGAGVAFWMINQFPELGADARILFPLASGYSAFNLSNMIPHDKIITLPENTKMILQVYAKDYTTDIRIGMDIFLNNSIQEKDKEFMLVYGDETHIADHGAMASSGYNSMIQRTIFRPLDALMDEAFNHNDQARLTMKEESKNDPYFNPFIGTTPQKDIADKYIFDIDFYHFNCHEVQGTIYISKRKDYCSALEL